MAANTQSRDISSSTVSLKDMVTYFIIAFGMVAAYYGGRSEQAVMAERVNTLMSRVKTLEDSQREMNNMVIELRSTINSSNAKQLEYLKKLTDEEDSTPGRSRR